MEHKFVKCKLRKSIKNAYPEQSLEFFPSNSHTRNRAYSIKNNKSRTTREISPYSSFDNTFFNPKILDLKPKSVIQNKLNSEINFRPLTAIRDSIIMRENIFKIYNAENEVEKLCLEYKNTNKNKEILNKSLDTNEFYNIQNSNKFIETFRTKNLFYKTTLFKKEFRLSLVKPIITIPHKSQNLRKSIKITPKNAFRLKFARPKNISQKPIKALNESQNEIKMKVLSNKRKTPDNKTREIIINMKIFNASQPNNTKNIKSNMKLNLMGKKLNKSYRENTVFPGALYPTSSKKLMPKP